MTAETITAALQAIAQKPDAHFALTDASGKRVVVRCEDKPWGTLYWIKSAGPGMEHDAGLELAADMLDWLSGPLTISQINGSTYEGG